MLSGCPLPVKLGGVRSHSHLKRVSRETEEEGYVKSTCILRGRGREPLSSGGIHVPGPHH